MAIPFNYVVLYLVTLVAVAAASNSAGGSSSEETVTLIVGNYYNLPSSFDAYFGFQTNPNDTTYYFMNNLAPILYWAQLPDTNTTTPIAQQLAVQSANVSGNNGVTAFTAFIDTQLNAAWIGSYDGMYLVNLGTNAVRSIQYTGIGLIASFVDVASRAGYLVANTQILWTVDLNNFNITYFTQSQINIFPNERAVVYDSDTRIAYIGGDSGIERINITSKVSMGITFFSNSSRASVLFRDDTKGRLYVCFDDDADVLSVVAYEISTMEQLVVFDLGEGNVYPGDTCAGGQLDTQTGQLFIVVNQAPSAIVLSWDLSTNGLNGFTGFTADPRELNASSLQSDVVGTVKFPGQREFFVLGFTQLVQVQYTTTCPSDCSGHGSCYYANCTCDEGDDCASARCLHDCLGNGVCSQGNCLCTVNYTSADCSLRQCPSACNDHGSCSGTPDYECSCTGGWSGFDCSIPPPPAPPPTCPELKDYNSCVEHSYCGWCGDIVHGKCMTGDIVGPVAGACTSWNFDQAPEIATIILASIILAVLGFMFVLDAISAIRLDWKRGNDLRDEYQTGLQRKPNLTEAAALWWRDQRAAKAWTTLEHIQFLSVFANLALNYPTRYLYFSRFMYWSNFGLPLPFLKDTTLHADRLTGYAQELGVEATRRELMGIEQYSNSLGILPHDLYAANMFWFAVAFFAIIVVYGSLSLICIKKIHWRVVFTCRLIYLGLMMTCGYAFVQSQHDYRIIVPAAVTLVVIGFGYPIGVYFILKGKNKQLFDNEFKFKFGCLYVNYRPENSLFSLRIIGRKFFTGIIMGILSINLDNSPKYVAIIQAGLLAIVQVLYLVELARTHPYYDHFHEYLEYFLVVVNVVAIGLSLIHYNAPNDAAYLITALIQVLALVACFGTYMISWMQMHPNFSFQKFFSGLCSRHKEEKGTLPMDTLDTSDTSIGINQE